MEVSIPIHVEEENLGQVKNSATAIVPTNWVDCPFKEHGCHKKGEKNEVKRHVRDDRYVVYSSWTRANALYRTQYASALC